jgi:hypothetical protein
MSVAVRLAGGNVLVRMDTLGQAKSIPPARHSHHFVQITAPSAAVFSAGELRTSRGLVTLNQLAITVGILLAYVVDAVFAGSGNWRCFRFVPETKGVPLERIERDLRLGRPLRDLGRTA